MNDPLKMLFHTTKGATLSAALSIWLICCCLPSTNPLVVPQELPSILSLIYSNIPPIKKGTDSRLGFGFRLGNQADFQVLLELGPQKNTRPIGENADSENSFNKRQVSKAHRAYLLRKQAQEALNQLPSSTGPSTSTSTNTSNEPTAASWLENWSKAMNKNMNGNNNNNHATVKKKSAPKFTQNAVQQSAKSIATLASAEESMAQLQMLLRMATTTTTASTITTPAPIDTVNSGSETPNSLITTVPQLQRLPASIAPFKGGPLNLGGPAGFTRRPPEELALQTISEQQSEKKSKSEITKELMDVRLEEGE